MARIRLLDEDDLDPADRDVLARPINLYRALAHVPELARRYRDLGRWIRFESSLDPRLRELAILQVGLLVWDRYEVSHHIKVGADFGVTDGDIEALVAEQDGVANAFGPRERVVLRAARELTATLTVTPATWAELRTHLPDDQRVDLVSVVGFYNMTARILGGLDVDVEESYRRHLVRFPGLVAQLGGLDGSRVG